MRTWQAENFGAGTGERKETACRQKSGHERKRKPRAGRKAGTREKGNRVQAEKRAREKKETVCRQKSGHESERNRMQAESRHERKAGGARLSEFRCACFILRRVHIALSAVVQKSASLELNADDFTLFWETICSASKTNLFHTKAMSSFCLFSISPIFYVRFGEFLFYIYIVRRDGESFHSSYLAPIKEICSPAEMPSKSNRRE